jgi:hypothetical protein
MLSNRPDGDSADVVQDAASPQIQAAAAYTSAAQVEICKLLSVVLSAARKRLNTPSAVPRPLGSYDLELAQMITIAASEYAKHLSLSDVFAVAAKTTADLERMKAFIAGVDDSRLLDDILAKTNELLEKERRNMTFLRAEQEIWLARRAEADSPYYLSARITTFPFFDATPPESMVPSEKY